MSQLSDQKRSTYSKHRQASQGAGITLVCGLEEYVASFECAKRIAVILGKRGLEDVGDGILESIPVYKIPFKDVSESLLELSKSVSVALVDLVCDTGDSRFMLIWKIEKMTVMGNPISEPVLKVVNLDDY